MFSEWNFNISFRRISNLSFYLNKSELKKDCQENHWVKGMTPGICFLEFAKVSHVRQNFLTRTWSRAAI